MRYRCGKAWECECEIFLVDAGQAGGLGSAHGGKPRREEQVVFPYSFQCGSGSPWGEQETSGVVLGLSCPVLCSEAHRS